MLNAKDFKVLKGQQYCDNKGCSHFELIGAGNIRIHSRLKGQVYCTICKNRWVVTKGTIRFGLKTPINKVIATLRMLAEGTGLRKTCRLQGITPNAAKKWMAKAGDHPEEFTHYMQHHLQMQQDQIDSFWKFIEKKKKKSNPI